MCQSTTKLKMSYFFRSKNTVRWCFATWGRGWLLVKYQSVKKNLCQWPQNIHIDTTVNHKSIAKKVSYLVSMTSNPIEIIDRFCIDDLDFLNSLSKSPKPIDPIKVGTFLVLANQYLYFWRPIHSISSMELVKVHRIDRVKDKLQN